MHTDEKKSHNAAGVPHTAACRDRIERAMGDAGDKRLDTAEQRIAEFIAEQIADSDIRTRTADISEEESSDASSSDIPLVPSRHNGNHARS